MSDNELKQQPCFNGREHHWVISEQRQTTHCCYCGEDKVTLQSNNEATSNHIPDCGKMVNEALIKEIEEAIEFAGDLTIRDADTRYYVEILAQALAELRK